MIHFVKRELETLLYVFDYHFLPFNALILCISTAFIAFRALPCPFSTFSKSRSLVTDDEHLRIFLMFSFSSLHYYFLSGVFLAFDIYRYKYSAPSPYIVNTIRDNEHFLWIGAGIWAVSSF